MKKKRGTEVTVQHDNALKNENNDRLIKFVFDNDGPEWERTVFYDFDSEDIFIPAQFVMSEMMALVALGYDGTKAIKNKDLLEHFKTLDKKIRGDLKPWEGYE